MSTRKDSKSDENNPLREHELTKKLVKDGKPVDYLCIKGYVGKSDSNDIVRIYLNLNFNEYVEIVKSDILHVEELSTDDLEHGGTCVWIRKDAEITNVKTESLKQQAQFLEGEIARAQLKPAPALRAAGGGEGGPFPTLFAPICPTEYPLSTCGIICPTLLVICNPTVRFPCSPRCGVESAYCPPPPPHSTQFYCTPRCSPRCGVESAYCPPPPPHSTQFYCTPRCSPRCGVESAYCPDTPYCPVYTPRCPVQTPRCQLEVESAYCPNDNVSIDPYDPITELKSQIEKLKAKVKKLEDEKK